MAAEVEAKPLGAGRGGGAFGAGGGGGGGGARSSSLKTAMRQQFVYKQGIDYLSRFFVFDSFDADFLGFGFGAGDGVPFLADDDT